MGSKGLEGKRQVAAYIYKKFGINSKKKFLQRVRDMEKTLKINPYFVNKDPLNQAAQIQEKL